MEGRQRGVGVLGGALLNGPGVVGSDLGGAVGVWVLVLPEGEVAVNISMVKPEDRVKARLSQVCHVTSGNARARWSTTETMYSVVNALQAIGALRAASARVVVGER